MSEIYGCVIHLARPNVCMLVVYTFGVFLRRLGKRIQIFGRHGDFPDESNGPIQSNGLIQADINILCKRKSCEPFEVFMHSLMRYKLWGVVDLLHISFSMNKRFVPNITRERF